MKKLLFTSLLLLAFCTKSHAQMAEVKLNIASAAVTIFNPSFEVGISEQSSITMDYVGAFAEENFMGTGYPLLLSMGSVGYRYYTKKNAHHGFFLGGDVGLNTFRMNKNIVPLVASDKAEDSYDVGYGFFAGMTFGYKININKRLSFETSISGGWQYSRHEGYTASGMRTVELNTSAEWLPYKAGVYLNYKIF